VATEDELILARRKHAAALGEAGSLPFPNDFAGDEARRREVLSVAGDQERRARLPGEQELTADAEHYPLYGRVMAKRGPFLVIRTPHGSAQALVRPEALPEKEAAMYRVVDLGDHVAVHGPLMRTKTGELAVKAARYRHLSKALLPLPAKWHGLTDVEKRYRQRYVDLFANEQVAVLFRARGFILDALRRFLEQRGFLEVETPMLHSLLGGARARPFTTHHNALDIPLYLRVAPELYLKRLLVGGFDRVYELGRCFRNEGVSSKHNPEFTILELYMAYATYEELVDLSVEMVRHIDSELQAAFPDLCQQRSFDLAAPWKRVTMRQALIDRLERAGQGAVEPTPWSGVLDRAGVLDDARLQGAIQQMLPGLAEPDRALVSGCRTYGERIYNLFELVAEEALPALYRNADGSRSIPVFITEHPVESSPLARRNESDPQWVDRFEIFLEGREIANAFSEINDPDEQAERFRAQLIERERGDQEAMDFDEDYVRALMHGMPPAAGFGLGVDRLVMFLCGQPSIRDVLLFPLLKPEAR
jgi:lysyl-tRNA synthetase class 2